MSGGQLQKFFNTSVKSKNNCRCIQAYIRIFPLMFGLVLLSTRAKNQMNAHPYNKSHHENLIDCHKIPLHMQNSQRSKNPSFAKQYGSEVMMLLHLRLLLFNNCSTSGNVIIHLRWRNFVHELLFIILKILFSIPETN